MPQLSDNDIRLLKEVIRMVKDLSGDGVSNDGKSIRIRQILPPPPIQQKILFPFVITGTATRPGHYKLSVFSSPALDLGNADVTSSNPLTIDDFGNNPKVFNAYGRNAWEVGQNTHSLVDYTNTNFVPNVFWGWLTSATSDGKPVYAFLGFQKEVCSQGGS